MYTCLAFKKRIFEWSLWLLESEGRNLVVLVRVANPTNWLIGVGKALELDGLLEIPFPFLQGLRWQLSFGWLWDISGQARVVVTAREWRHIRVQIHILGKSWRGGPLDVTSLLPIQKLVCLPNLMSPCGWCVPWCISWVEKNGVMAAGSWGSKLWPFGPPGLGYLDALSWCNELCGSGGGPAGFGKIRWEGGYFLVCFRVRRTCVFGNDWGMPPVPTNPGVGTQLVVTSMQWRNPSPQDGFFWA